MVAVNDQGAKSSAFRAGRAAVVLSGSAFSFLMPMALIPALTSMSAHFAARGSSPLVAQMIMAAPAIASIVGALLISVFAARFGKRLCMLIILLLYAVGGGVGLLQPSYEVLLAARLIQGLAGGALVPLSIGLIGDYYSGRARARMLGLNETFQALSAIVAIGLSGVLVERFGWSASFGIYLVSLPFFVLGLFVINEPVAQPHAAATQESRSRSSAKAFPLAEIFISAFFLGIGLFMLAIQGPLRLVEAGIVTPSQQGLVSLMPNVGLILAGLAYGILHRFISPAIMIRTSIGFVGLGLIVIGQVETLPLIVAGYFLCGLFGGFLMPAMNDYTMNNTTGAVRSLALGVTFSIVSMAQFLNPVLINPVRLAVGIRGAFEVVGLVLIALALLVSVLAWSLRKAPSTKARKMEVVPHRLLINGKLVEGASKLDVINPATGRVFAQCGRADAAQLNEAVKAANLAFPTWSALGWLKRRALLIEIVDAVQLRAEEFARLLTLEQGKPLAQARFEIMGAMGALRVFADMDTPIKVLVESVSERVIQHRTPLGTVAAIMPWNYPILLMMMKVGPALITGNTVVAKPAPTTPLTTLLFGEVVAGILPHGVFNVIVDANDLGQQLTEHPGIAKISFTGSTATGKKVMASAAGTLKRITLELGGNDAAIVLEDADIKLVASRVFQAATLNAGQVCLAAKRIFVPRAIYDVFCDELAVLAKAAVVGDGLEVGVEIGPIQNRQQFERLKSYLIDAAAQGRIIAGGRVLDRDGYFVEPTVVRDIPDSARLVCEEQFGPILPVLPYDDIDEVIARANHGDYGLAGTIWTSNPEKAMGIAMRLDTGMVWINRHLEVAPNIPMGGAKQSGFGVENAQEGIEEYTQSKIVSMAL